MPADIPWLAINVGNNLVGVPLDPVIDMMISDALVEGVGAIAVSNAAGDGFHTIQAEGDTGDGPVHGRRRVHCCRNRGRHYPNLRFSLGETTEP